jgi:hypothetical protein
VPVETPSVPPTAVSPEITGGSCGVIAPVMQSGCGSADAVGASRTSASAASAMIEQKLLRTGASFVV